MDHCSTEQMLTKDDQKNVKLIKKIVTEKKTKWPSYKNCDMKNVKEDMILIKVLITNTQHATSKNKMT